MKIKCRLNNEVSSFEFYFDLRKNDFLKKILRLYEIQEVYLCVYGLYEKDLEGRLKGLEIKNFSSLSSKSSQDFAFQIGVDNISKLFSIFENDFDEILVWSCDINWDQFIMKCLEEVSFWTLHKTQEVCAFNFMLNFNPYESYKVLIISKLMYHNTKTITKSDVANILCCED